MPRRLLALPLLFYYIMFHWFPSLGCHSSLMTLGACTFSCKYCHQSREIWRQMRARVMRHVTVGWLPTLLFVVTCTTFDQSSVVTIGFDANAGCWISNRVANLCVFSTPVSFSLVFNIAYFLRAKKAIRQTKRQTRNATKQSQNGNNFPIFARIVALMGFSWLFGFLAMLISKYL